MFEDPIAKANQFVNFVEVSRNAVGADNCCVHLVSKDRKRIVCQAVSDGYRPTHLAHGLDLSACLGVTEVLRTQVPLAIDNAVEDARVAAVARRRYGLQSCLYVPLVADSESIGVAIYSYVKPHRWQEQQIDKALEDSRLLSAAVNNAGQLTSPIELDEVKLLDAAPLQIALVDENFLLLWANAALAGGGEDVSATRIPRLRVSGMFTEGERAHDLRMAARSIFRGELGSYLAMVDQDEQTWRVELRLAVQDHGETALAVSAVNVTEVAEAQYALESSRQLKALINWRMLLNSCATDAES